MHWTEISVRERGAVVVIEPRGQLTLSSDDERRLMPVIVRCLDAGTRLFLLNLRHLPLVDSTGVGELVAAYTRVARHGGDLKLCEVQPRVAEILTATRLDAVLASLSTEDDALDWMIRS